MFVDDVNLGHLCAFDHSNEPCTTVSSFTGWLQCWMEAAEIVDGAVVIYVGRKP